MKKILRLVTTSVLTLTLVACGEASTTSSTNSATTSSVTSVSSAFANVTSVNLSAASNLLTQTLGTPRTVTVTAVLNANTNPNLSVEWFVNGVKQQQTGRVLDYTPTAAGAFAITARVGNVTSNVLTVNVGLPTINITKTEFVTSRQLALTADAGASVTVVGAKLEDSSYFDLKTGRYILNFESPVEQGTNLTVRLERPGFGVKVEQVLFDTRQFSLDTVELVAGSGLTLVNGVYQVTRPYDAGAQYAKVVELSFKQKNILSVLKEQEFRVTTAVPTGSTAVAPSSTLITELGTQQVTINSTTALGLYTFTYTLGGKSVEVKLQVNEPKPEIVINETYTDNDHYDEVTGELIKFGVAFTETVDGVVEYTHIETDSTGAFIVEKPFSSITARKTLLINFAARNFAADEFINNQWSVNLFGPSVNVAGRTQLFAGMELDNASDASANNSDLTTNNTFEDFNGTLATTGGALRTSANGIVTQKIDRGTPVGEYTFTVSAGQPGKEITQDFVVKVVEPTPEIRFDVVGAYTQNGLDNSTAKYRDFPVEVNGNTYTIEKPFDQDVTLNFGWLATLVNYQSALETDLTKISEDIIKQDLSARTLFSKSTGIKDFELNGSGKINLEDADFLVGRNTTNNIIQVRPENLGIDAKDVVNYIVIRTTAAITGIETLALTEAAIVADAENDLVVVSDLKTSLSNGFMIIEEDMDVLNSVALGTEVQYTLILNVNPSLTAVAGQIDLHDINNVSAGGIDNLADGTIGASQDLFNLSVAITDYADVIEMGDGQLLNASGSLYGANESMYRFVRMGMTVTGPSNLIEQLPIRRTAILLDSGDTALEFISQVQYWKNGSIGTLSSINDDFNNLVDNDVAAYADLYNYDNSGFERKTLEITSATVAGTYTLTFIVDNLEKVVNIVVRNPQPKLFVMSGNRDNGAPLLPNKPISVLSGAAVESFATSGPLFNKIKFYDALGAFENTTTVKDTTISAGPAGEHYYDVNDKFVTAVNGVYTIELPAAAKVTNSTYGLFAQMAVADLAKGTYNYRISKSYPSGRNEVFSDTVTVVDVDANQLAVFDTANKKFIDNFIIAELGLELGTHTFEFTVGSLTNKVVVEVVEMPAFKVEKLTLGSAIATFYENYFLVPVPTVNPTAQSPSRVLLDVSKAGLTDENYFVATALLHDSTLINKIKLNELNVLDGVLLLDLGSFTNNLIGSDGLRLTLEFFRKVSYKDYLISLGYTGETFVADNSPTAGYIQIGEPQVINILLFTPNNTPG
jgi:hypothetical protein